MSHYREHRQTDAARHMATVSPRVLVMAAESPMTSASVRHDAFGPVGASMKAHAEPKATVTRTRERGRLVIGMAVVAGGTVPYRVPTGTGIPLREL